MLIVLFLVSHFNFLFVPCGGLSWLPVSFSLYVKYTLSYRIVSYRIVSYSCRLVSFLFIYRVFSLFYNKYLKICSIFETNRKIKQELSYRQHNTLRASTMHKYYTVTLKLRLSVIRGHWKRNHWTDHTPVSSIVGYLTLNTIMTLKCGH